MIKTSERRKQRYVEQHRSIAHRARAENIPRRAHRDHREANRKAAMTGDQPGRKPPDVVDEKIRVQRHLENAAREREPRFLIAPEASHAAAHPDVEAALFGNGGGEFADHHGGRDAPEQRRDQRGLGAWRR